MRCIWDGQIDSAGMEAELARPLLPWLGRACRQAREERDVVRVKIAAAIPVNQATIAAV
jgi:hypothetical protein